MTDHDFTLHPEHWLDRAEKTRATALNAHDPRDRERLLKIAREYEHLAARAEEWKSERPQT